MSFTLEVDDTRVRAKFEKFPLVLQTALANHVERFVIFLQSYVRSQKLSGDPLHRRTGNLSASINYTPVKTTGHSVESSVGTNLAYGRVHELGGTFNIPAYMHPGRKAGADIREAGIKVKNASSFRYAPFLVRAHTATYPKRAFLAPSLQENKAVFEDEMNAAVKEAVL
jgi:phage gpG-like protein